MGNSQQLLLVLLTLLSIVHCQRRPHVPQVYYFESSISLLDAQVGFANMAYDKANSRFFVKQYMLEHQEIEIVAELPLTTVSYHSYDGESNCNVGCCNGWLGGSSESSQEISSESSSSYSTWWYWYSSESSDEEREAKEIEPAVNRDNKRMKFEESILQRLGIVSFRQEQCSEPYQLDDDDNFFGKLQISKYTGLCSYNGRNGNLWSFMNYGELASYCMEVDGTPIYYEEEGIYVYVDYYTTVITEDVYAIPESCGCEIDWDYYQ